MQHQVNGPSQVTTAILAVILFQNVTNTLQSDRSIPLLSNTLPLHSYKCSWDSWVLFLQNQQPRSIKGLLMLTFTPAIILLCISSIFCFFVETLPLVKDCFIFEQDVAYNISSNTVTYWLVKVLVTSQNITNYRNHKFDHQITVNGLGC